MKNDEPLIFLFGFILGISITIMVAITISDSKLGCEFGWHVPIAEVDIVYWEANNDIVLNYWIRCERCGHFLSGITSEHYPLEELLK